MPYSQQRSKKMSDEALNAHLDWLDKCIDGDDYEIWLENRVEELEAAVALAKQRTGRFTSDLLKSGDLVEIAGEFVPRSQLEDDVLRNTISLLKNENERLTKHVEDYKEENAALKGGIEILKGDDDGTERCMICGSMVEQIWHVSDELWNELSGYPQGDGILCSRCFDRKARDKGVYLYWTCQLGSYPETVALLTEQESE